MDGDPAAKALLGAMAANVGRVVVNDWPTGVAYTWAQQHGGPWPATTNPAATSVGAGALDRFVRPIALQNFPARLLPPALAEDNPWRISRRVDGQLRVMSA